MDEMGPKPALESSFPEPQPAPEPTPPTETPSTRRKRPSKKVTVKLLTKELFDGQRLVYDVQSLQAYLVPSDAVAYSVREQEIDADVLEKSIKPYDWTAEIEQVMPSIEQIRLAIWSNGYVSKEDIGRRKNPPFYGAFPAKFQEK